MRKRATENEKELGRVRFIGNTFGEKTNKNKVIYWHSKGSMATIFSLAPSGRSCKVSVKVCSGCFLEASLASDLLFILSLRSCFFNHTTTLSCMSMTRFLSACKALSPLLNTLFSLCCLQACDTTRKDKEQQVHTFYFYSRWEFSYKKRYDSFTFS